MQTLVLTLGGFILLTLLVRLLMTVTLKIRQALRAQASSQVADPTVAEVQVQYLRARSNLEHLLSILNLFVAGMMLIDIASGSSFHRIPAVGMWVGLIGILPWFLARYGFPARHAKQCGAFSWGQRGMLIELGCMTMLIAALLLGFEVTRAPFIMASYGTAAVFSVWLLGPWRTT